MMNFKQFFENNSIVNLKLASNPRHRTVGGITNGHRKHQNIVARSQQKSNEYISNNVINAKYNGGKSKISEYQAKEEANKYNINLDNKDKSMPFQIALKQKDANGIGRFLVYDPNNGYSIQIKKA